MSNHYHLLLETPQPNLVAGMQWLQNTFMRRFNVRHRQWGHLFGGRYKAALVEGGAGSLPTAQASAHDACDYYLAALDYIHLNPVRAGLVRVGQGDGLLDYPWSSLAQGHALPPRERPAWLESAAAMQAAGCADDARGRRAFVERLEQRALEESAAKSGTALPEGQTLNSTLARGWYFGSQAFRDRALEAAKAAGRALGRRGDVHESAQLQRAHGHLEAERLVAAALATLGMGEDDVQARRRGDARPAQIAALVRRRTSVGLGWVAERLHLRSADNAAQAVRRVEQAVKSGKLEADAKRTHQLLSELSWSSPDLFGGPFAAPAGARGGPTTRSAAPPRPLQRVGADSPARGPGRPLSGQAASTPSAPGIPDRGDRLR